MTSQLTLQPQKGLSGFALKSIALCVMVLDHIHYFFSFTGKIPEWFSMAGRLSAPLFLFCLVEGFVHTHDRRRYFLRIYAIAIGMGLTQFCFYLFPSLQRPDGFFPQNAIFQSFSLLLVVLQGFAWCKERHWGKGLAAILLPLVWPYAVMCLYVCFPEQSSVYGFWVNLLHFTLLPIHTWISDGGTFFLLEGIALYLLRHHRRAQAAVFFCLDILFYGVRVYLLVPGLTLAQMFTEAYEWYGAFAAILMLLYNGQRGKGPKRFFYWFYPAHVYILFALSWGVFLLLR